MLASQDLLEGQAQAMQRQAFQSHASVLVTGAERE